MIYLKAFFTDLSRFFVSKLSTTVDIYYIIDKITLDEFKKRYLELNTKKKTGYFLNNFRSLRIILFFVSSYNIYFFLNILLK